MLSLNRDGYTASAVRSALLSDHREIRFAFEHLGPDNLPKGWFSGVQSASISYNSLAQIHRTMKFEVRDSDDVDWLKDRVQPWFYLTMPDGGEVSFPLGIFLMITPSRTVTGLAQRVYRSVECYDQILVLRDDKVDDRYTVVQGTNYIEAVSTILANAGVQFQDLTNNTSVLPTARDWSPGTTKLEIVNDLLRALNYRSMYFNAGGFAVGEPYVSPANRPSEFTYAADAESVISPDAEYEFDLFDVPNEWVLTVSQPDRDPLVATYTNDNPNSPTSTVSRGRTITDYRDSQNEDAVSQAVLDARVERIAENASQIYSAVNFETAIMPMHAHADVFTLNYPALGANEKFSEHTWSFNFEPGAKMSHRIRLVVTV